MNPGSEVKIPFDHYEEISEFSKKLEETNNIKVNNEYFEIRFIAVD